MNDPSLDEWNRALSKSGGEGRCKAEVIGKYNEGEYTGIEFNFLEENIQDVDGVVVAIGEDFESLMLCVVQLMELKVNRIMARANGKHQHMILQKIGVKEILSPENDVGLAVAERLINPNILTSLILPDNYEIVEIKTPRTMANRQLGDIDLRTKYNLNLITLKRESEMISEGEVVKEAHILGVPNSETVLIESDTIIVFGLVKDIERFIEINK